MESLETEIQALLRRFDIQNEEHRDELSACKIEEIKTADSKILNFLSDEEFEPELPESLIRKDTFIDIMTKIDRVFNLETNDSEHSSVRETTSNHTPSPSNPPKLLK